MSRSVSSHAYHSNDLIDNEMHEFLSSTTSGQIFETNQQNEFHAADDIPVPESHQRLLLSNRVSSIADSRNSLSIHRHISRLKNKLTKKLKGDHSNQNDENEQEKNKGYILVENYNLDLILISNDNINQELRQSTELSVHTDERFFDRNPIGFLSPTQSTNDLLRTQQSILDLKQNPANTYVSDSLLTQSNVACCKPKSHIFNVDDTNISDSIATQSSCSTIYSNDEFTGVDRATLSDDEYIQAQEADLRRITMLYLSLSKKLSDYQDVAYLNSTSDRLYSEELAKKLSLTQELQKLTKQHELMISSWTCQFCTRINRPYVETSLDLCAACDAPSPLKRYFSHVN